MTLFISINMTLYSYINWVQNGGSCVSTFINLSKKNGSSKLGPHKKRGNGLKTLDQSI